MKTVPENYTYAQLARYAYALSQELGVKTMFNQETRSAGKHWVKLFLKRHPECRKQTVADLQEEEVEESPC